MKKSLAEIYEDESEMFGPASVTGNPYKDLEYVNEIDLRKYEVTIRTKKEQIKRGYFCVQETVNNLRQRFSEAATAVRRTGSG